MGSIKSIKIELAVGDEELSKIETLWKEGQQVRYNLLKETKSKTNFYSKQMVDLRTKMYKDSQIFATKYKDLVGQDASNTIQMKDWASAIKSADAKIKELNDYGDKVGQLL